MQIDYKPLLKLLIDKDMKLGDLSKGENKLSSATVSKIRKNEPMSMGALNKICKKLKCNISDIVEMDYSNKEKDTVVKHEGTIIIGKEGVNYVN